MFKLLIAVVGSDHASRAIEVAARLAGLVPQTEAVLLHVRELPVYYGEVPIFDFDAVEQASRRHQDQLLATALTHARASGLQQVVTLGVEGLPATEIVRVAGDRAVDQIVMGTHGRNALGGLLLGSVAQRVVHLAKVPVLLVK